jgi:demethylmenaquinone methyltransferase / 2-methoxy-6-polyprenyl-1,4-benzoquinol methylase
VNAGVKLNRVGNKFYQPGQERGSKVQDLFAAVAPRYDLINDLQSFGLHRRWKRKVVELAQPQAGATALDLCCGTGDLAFLLAKHSARVTGFDFSEAMLQVARSRAEKHGSPASLEFLQGDAHTLPFPENTFDIVTVGYGLRNLADWKRGLAEMWRVAKVGGRILVLDFGKPPNPVWRGLYFAYLRTFVPIFGKLFCGDSATHGYIYESLKHYPAQTGVAEEMTRLGCGEVRVINLVGGAMSINAGIKALGSSLNIQQCFL